MSDPLPDQLEVQSRVGVRVSGVNKGIRRWLNFLPGAANVTVAAVDDPTGEEIDLTLGLSLTDLAGNGLGSSGAGLVVNVDGSTIEINADTLRVKDSGITSAKILDG